MNDITIIDSHGPHPRDPKKRADWRRVEELYRQLKLVLNSKGNVLPPSLVGSLAETTGRVFAHYHEREEEFIDDLLTLWSEVDGLSSTPKDRFRELYHDKRFDRFPEYNPGGHRRRPKPFEASVETVRRLIDLNQIRKELEPIGTAAILGGSASYGRHFNTVGATHNSPSDLDIILVIQRYDALPKVIERLRHFKAIDSTGLDVMQERIRPFSNIRQANPHCIFSGKVNTWDSPDPRLNPYHISGTYTLSFHILDVNDFDYVALSDIPVIQGDNFVRSVADFRNTPPPADGDKGRSFAGINLSLPIACEKVEGGYLTTRSVGCIKQERYYPGLQQCVILPQCEIRWESAKVNLAFRTLAFRWKIMERLRAERVLRPFEDQSLGLSHVRSEVFAPHITKRSNRE